MSDAINPQHYKRLPAEAIEIIEAAIDRAPSNRDALLHGQALKYLLRCWNKNGIEDLKKAKWYLDRLIDSFDESEAEQLATGEVAVEVTGEVKPPDGWRWLERGELIRKGDRFFSDTDWKDRNWGIGEKYSSIHQKTIRRNRFEVGEKVVHVGDSKPTQYAIAGYNESLGAYAIKYKEGEYLYHPSKLAPYIEETKPTPEVTPEVTVEVKPPDGWRWLEVGEVIRKGDRFWYEGAWHDRHEDLIGCKYSVHHCQTIRRNKFEVGEKVVAKDSNEIWEVTSVINGVYQLKNDLGFFASFPEHLAPYIEDAN